MVPAVNMSNMAAQVLRLLAALSAQMANVRILARVLSMVHVPGAVVHKPLVTVFTFVWPFARVSPQMDHARPYGIPK